MDERELRMKCIEAAARNPLPHPDGYAAGILESAQAFYAWVASGKSGEKGVSELL